MIFLAFLCGLFLGAFLGVILMAVVIGAKKTRGGCYLPEDD